MYMLCPVMEDPGGGMRRPCVGQLESRVRRGSPLAFEGSMLRGWVLSRHERLFPEFRGSAAAMEVALQSPGFGNASKTLNVFSSLPLPLPEIGEGIRK